MLPRSATSVSTLPPFEIGGALARDFIQAHWLRVQLGAPEASLSDMDLWCPKQRLQFRLPLWWAVPDLTIDDDAVLQEIYAGFATCLRTVAQNCGDPELNQSIAAALSHLAGRDPTASSDQPLPYFDGDEA